MKTAQDFQLEAPVSLRDIVRDEMIASNQEDFRRKKPIQPITDEGINELMKRVYEKIEREALAVYHSNEPWALRQWALGNILKDEVVNEAVAEIAHNLISPVIEWQESQPFDPIAYFAKQLTRKAQTTKEGYM